MEQPKEYYAFISYKREDKKEAKRLQHVMEYYRQPNHLRQENLDLPQEDREKMVNDLLAMYSDSKAIMAYANDVVFRDEFWNNISYQTDVQTPAMKNGVVDPDAFMDAPMSEATHLSEEDVKAAVNSTIQLQSASGAKLYRVEKGITRYLWLATRMGMPSVKDAPGIEIMQTYNLLTQVVQTYNLNKER